MLNIKSLTTGVTAAALVSAIGLVYAQTSTYPAAAAETTPATTTATTGDTSMPNSAPSTRANDTVTEPAPKADRN